MPKTPPSSGAGGMADASPTTPTTCYICKLQGIRRHILPVDESVVDYFGLSRNLHSAALSSIPIATVPGSVLGIFASRHRSPPMLNSRPFLSLICLGLGVALGL